MSCIIRIAVIYFLRRKDKCPSQKDRQEEMSLRFYKYEGV